MSDKKQKIAPVQPEVALNRAALMMKAKDRGIKNFRVLNKSELEEVLAEGVTPYAVPLCLDQSLNTCGRFKISEESPPLEQSFQALRIPTRAF